MDDTDFVAVPLAKPPSRWKIDALLATQGNQSKLGAILIAVLGRAPDNPPRFGSGAVITSDGAVLCHFQDKRGDWHEGAFVCSVAELVSNFRGLADHLKLSDEDRKDMLNEVRMWVTTDYRAKSELF
jgi:hypothetical protein